MQTRHIASLAVTGSLVAGIHIEIGLAVGKGCKSVAGASWGGWRDRQVEERKVCRLAEQRRIAAVALEGARPQV